MTSLFITVGSTSFPQLTDLALSPAFLSILAQKGIADVVVQYGSADITVPPVAQNGRMSGKGEGTFVYTVQDEDGEGGVSDRARGYSGNREGSTGAGASGYSSERWGRGQVHVRFLRYTSEFDKEVARADVVISHAGTFTSRTACTLGRTKEECDADDVSQPCSICSMASPREPTRSGQRCLDR
jgi:beta-1,4-N-acetylglucosaminyltransferase